MLAIPFRIRTNYLRCSRLNLKSIKTNSLNRNKTVQRPVALTSQNQHVALSPVKNQPRLLQSWSSKKLFFTLSDCSEAQAGEESLYFKTNTLHLQEFIGTNSTTSNT